eukprot:3634689-Rhodomonas_salina.1
MHTTSWDPTVTRSNTSCSSAYPFPLIAAFAASHSAWLCSLDNNLIPPFHARCCGKRAHVRAGDLDSADDSKFSFRPLVIVRDRRACGKI